MDDETSLRLIQQQLLLFNSLSNRLTWLFTDLSQNGVSSQITRPHETALNRMIGASRDLQLKLQKSIRRIVRNDLQTSTKELDELDKEKKRLESQLSIVSDKLSFFSNEYQRVTEMYVSEKTQNEKLVRLLIIKLNVLESRIGYETRFHFYFTK